MTVRVDDGDFDGYFFGNVRGKVRPVILHGDMLPLVGLQGCN